MLLAAAHGSMKATGAPVHHTVSIPAQVVSRIFVLLPALYM